LQIFTSLLQTTVETVFPTNFDTLLAACCYQVSSSCSYGRVTYLKYHHGSGMGFYQELCTPLPCYLVVLGNTGSNKLQAADNSTADRWQVWSAGHRAGQQSWRFAAA